MKGLPGPGLKAGGVALVLLLSSGCNDPSTSPDRASAVATPALAAASGPTDKHIFSLKGHVPTDFAGRVVALGGKVDKVYDQIDVVVTQGLSDDAAASLVKGGGVVDRDVRRQMVPSLGQMSASVISLPNAVGPSSILPPEAAAFQAFQWDMRQIHAPEAWASGRNGIPSVEVAILDTGLDPDHLDQMGLIDVANSTAFEPSVSGPPVWADDHFHGTHVGGLVTSNNFGIAGVAPDVTLMAVKVLDATGHGTDADVIGGILWATDHGAQVINMSLGDYGPRNNGKPSSHTAFNRAVNYAHRHGVLVVSAAGNSGIDLQHDQNNIATPCEAGVQLCVSSTGPTDTKSTFSNYGTNAINVAAPGGELSEDAGTFVLSLCSSRSVMPELADCKDRVTYLFVIGTSQAAPHVSGLGALLDSQYGGSLNASQLITRIEQGADDLGKPGADEFYGKGRINVFNTLSGAPTP